MHEEPSLPQWWARGAALTPGVGAAPRAGLGTVSNSPASAPDALKVVRSDHSVDAVIVLGTSAQQDLPPHSRDLRVISIMLLLRKLQHRRQ